MPSRERYLVCRQALHTAQTVNDHRKLPDQALYEQWSGAGSASEISKQVRLTWIAGLRR